MFSKLFLALNREAHFTRDMLAAGATEIRKANYASKGTYFTAFTTLSTGFERIGKLCLIGLQQQSLQKRTMLLKNSLGQELLH